MTGGWRLPGSAEGALITTLDSKGHWGWQIQRGSLAQGGCQRGTLTELSLLFSDDVSFSLEALAVSEGADGAVEELPWDDLFPVSVLASASASC